LKTWPIACYLNAALIKNKVARLTERKTDIQDALNDPFLVA
jgi:hypothetical protein